MAVQHDGLDDLVADRVYGAERGHRLLRNERDLGAADVAHLGTLWWQAREIDDLAALLLPRRATAEHDLPVRYFSGTFDKLQNGLHRDALAAAAFADNAEHLAGHDVEAGAVDGAHEPVLQGEGDPEIADGQQRHLGLTVHGHCLSRYTGRPHRAARRRQG